MELVSCQWQLVTLGCFNRPDREIYFNFSVPEVHDGSLLHELMEITRVAEACFQYDL